MRCKRVKSVCTRAIGVLAAVLALMHAATAAPKYKVLHGFGARGDGGGLYGSLALDAKGNVYGETSGGGDYGYGTAFRLSPQPDGQWSETILHSFKNNDPDGDDLNGGFMLDTEGNLYGTASMGGGSGKSGTVFELTPGSGGWDLTVLHRFGGQFGSPKGSLITGQEGNLYGTAGNPFEMSRSHGRWKVTLLHNFPSFRGDGVGAYGLVIDASGNLYGTTVQGGTSTACGGGCGTAYELHPTSGGSWKEYILHDFGVGDDNMAFPNSVLTVDKAGNLYGVAPIGGSAGGNGAVYRLSRGSGGHWKTAIQHSFTGGAGGANPAGGLVMDKSGNFYGVTAVGGDPNCYCGLVYKLAPKTKGKWKYTVLHTFTGYDGAQPDAQLILDDKGNLYGTTVTGGAAGAGVAFELTP